MHHPDHDHDHNCTCGDHFRPQSFEAVLEVASELEDSIVVHGWLQRGSRWILHAWAESGEAVYDLTETREPQHRSEYYAHNGATEERLRRYGRVEFFTLFADTGSFGPFDKDFFFSEEVDTDPLQRT